MIFGKITSVLVAWMISAASLAVAGEDRSAPSAGLHGNIGMGMNVIPEYEGSGGSKTRVMPAINLYYGDLLFLTRMTAGANLLHYQTVQGVSITAGPLLALRSGRNQDANDALKGLGDIGWSLDTGGFVRFRKQNWQASVDIRQNLSDTAQGATVNFSTGMGLPLSTNLRLRPGLEATWASSGYMKTFFGIDALQSAQSGLARYEAGSGFKHAGASLMADYSINHEWAGFASLRYKRLLGDASNSPIVANLGSKDQLSAGIGIKYSF